MRYRPALAIVCFAIASLSYAQMKGHDAGRDLTPLWQQAASHPHCILGARCPIPLGPSSAPLQPFVPPAPNAASPIETDCRVLPTQIERDHCVSQKLHSI
jgi:hypothetical protein